MKEQRRINVYLPSTLQEERRYPVIYMPDGELAEDFPHVANTIDPAIRKGRIAPVIPVGIENTQRRRDMTAKRGQRTFPFETPCCLWPAARKILSPLSVGEPSAAAGAGVARRSLVHSSQGLRRGLSCASGVPALSALICACACLASNGRWASASARTCRCRGEWIDASRVPTTKRKTHATRAVFMVIGYGKEW